MEETETYREKMKHQRNYNIQREHKTKKNGNNKNEIIREHESS